RRTELLATVADRQVDERVEVPLLRAQVVEQLAVDAVQLGAHRGEQVVQRQGSARRVHPSPFVRVASVPFPIFGRSEAESSSPLRPFLNSVMPRPSDFAMPGMRVPNSSSAMIRITQSSVGPRNARWAVIGGSRRWAEETLYACAGRAPSHGGRFHALGARTA